MHARARLEAYRRGPRTVCTTLRSDPPLTLRAALGGAYLVGSAAGPLGGDDLRLDVVVGPDADLDVRSVASQLIHPGPLGAPSSAAVHVEVQARARLRWLPEPTVVVAGARHRSELSVTLHDSASLVVSEVLVLGRHRQASGSILSRLRVDRDGHPVLRSDLALGPSWPCSTSSAVVGDHRVVGQVLLAGPGITAPTLPETPGGLHVGIATLASSDLLLTVVGDDAVGVGRVVTAAVDGCRAS